jgi:hypothetical protein
MSLGRHLLFGQCKVLLQLLKEAHLCRLLLDPHLTRNTSFVKHAKTNATLRPVSNPNLPETVPSGEIHTKSFMRSAMVGCASGGGMFCSPHPLPLDRLLVSAGPDPRKEVYGTRTCECCSVAEGACE